MLKSEFLYIKKKQLKRKVLIKHQIYVDNYFNGVNHV